MFFVQFSCFATAKSFGASILDSLLKANKASHTKGVLSYGGLDHQYKIQSTELPPNDAFHRKLYNRYLLDADNYESFILMLNAVTTNEAVFELKVTKPRSTEDYNCQYVKDKTTRTIEFFQGLFVRW